MGVLNAHAFNWPGQIQYDPIIKSLLLVRFIILIFVVDTLIFNKILDLKKFGSHRRRISIDSSIR